VATILTTSIHQSIESSKATLLVLLFTSYNSITTFVVKILILLGPVPPRLVTLTTSTPLWLVSNPRPSTLNPSMLYLVTLILKTPTPQLKWRTNNRQIKPPATTHT
jgi:hypothetical protein